MKSNLLDLVKENSDLLIYPLVNREVCKDDCHYSLGELGHAEIREYINVDPYGDNDTTIVFKNDHEEYFNWLMEDYLYENYDATEEKAEKEVNKKIAELDWKKAIFVYVERCNHDKRSF